MTIKCTEENRRSAKTWKKQKWNCDRMRDKQKGEKSRHKQQTICFSSGKWRKHIHTHLKRKWNSVAYLRSFVFISLFWIVFSSLLILFFLLFKKSTRIFAWNGNSTCSKQSHFWVLFCCVGGSKQFSFGPTYRILRRWLFRQVFDCRRLKLQHFWCAFNVHVHIQCIIGLFISPNHFLILSNDGKLI